ncbi:isopentenyl-diphosphate delta-isomerase [Clostridium putrefaciens]|uniref:Isopentenyl-diphosphate delta-isomerase n=1 Tax=Clostridium putrefaciens TaxID=99675 RepID=A0A381J920_9CLOT|nr:isopentenyl-diphosphate Delta-isomerase [Clostridium putrefaciens]SUY46897.1 isopentenyl-diphosphate delta-isomerase [Clostridium putrefaciens]
MSNEEMILLVDQDDKEIGYGEKAEVHKKGIFHRAFSIFIFNSKGELLLQKREKNKYHSPSLWTNTCCSHQRMGENLNEATHRRLKEEMGFDAELEEIFKFSYNIEFNENLHENEYDHVFIGKHNGEVTINPKEVEEFKWVDLKELNKDIKEFPKRYTYWFKLSIGKVIEYIY